LVDPEPFVAEESAQGEPPPDDVRRERGLDVAKLLSHLRYEILDLRKVDSHRGKLASDPFPLIPECPELRLRGIHVAELDGQVEGAFDLLVQLSEFRF
jgi:hypothetical protein